jgi:hypothetical protein
LAHLKCRNFRKFSISLEKFKKSKIKLKNHQEDAGIVKVLWYVSPNQKLTRGVSHCGLVICIKKYLKAKEELWKLKYFTMQKYNLPKTL